MERLEQNEEYVGWDLPGGVNGGNVSLDGFPGISSHVEKDVSDLVSINLNDNPEIQKKVLDFENKVHATPKIRRGVDFVALRSALFLHPELLEKMLILDAKGHNMNLLDQTDSSFVFVSSWVNVKEVAKEHRFLVYDEKALKQALFRVSTFCNGSLEKIISELGVQLVTEDDYKKIIENYRINGRSWLKTPDTLREDDLALMGRDDDVLEVSPDCCLDFASFRAKVVVPRG